MRDDAGDHAVQLEDGGDFDEEGREGGGLRRRGGGAWAGADAGDFDVVGPGDEQS